ncbi:hypothetical protein BVRB_4g071960 [Beta vulgaris subsp. vulgaris]|nr:hypothetical protein BVRB_4g071960 [Beta vulgaris subsp. vulgaris]
MAKPLSCISSFFTILIFLLSLSISAETRGNIPVSKSLTATINSSSWLSPSGDFAFGFHQFLNNTHLFLLAIWYAKIPDTIVWYANDGNPVPQGSTVTLTADQGLILSDPQGSQLWNSSVVLSGADVISYGFLNDSGNLVLKSSSNNDTVWQSFEHPTDTLLPTQTMETDGTVDSRLSETSFTKGRFQLHLQSDGNLVFNVMDPTTYMADIQPYYATGTWKPPSQGKQVIYTNLGHMYVVAANGTKLYDFIPEDKIVSINNNYHRATLNSNGVLTWYYHPRNFTQNNDVGWSKMYSQPGNICSVGCGYNSICSYDDEDQSVRCNCPPNYSLIDPNEKYASCKPDFVLWEEDGQGTDFEYNLVPLENTRFSKCDGTFHGISEERCKRSCLNDHLCAVATWDTDNGGTCCKNKPLFSCGNHGSDVGKTAWLKVGNGTNSTTPSDLPEEKAKMNIVLSVILGGSLFVNIGLLILGIFFIYNKKQVRSVKQPCEYGNVHCFSYKALEEATDGFKKKLGSGAFGIVYKGMIRTGSSPLFVAVKKLDRISPS